MNEASLHTAVLDAVLEARDPSRVEEELADHPELIAEYRRLRRAWEELGELPEPDAPPAVRREVRKALMGTAEASPVVPSGRLRWPAAVAAAALLFWSGMVVERWTGVEEPLLPDSATPALTEGSDEPRYVLLIRGGDSRGEEAGVEAMTAWARSLYSRDRLVWAERLPSQAAVRVGGEEAGPVGGLFVIRAQDGDEAVRLARESPHLELGGSVEVLPTATAIGR